jgi:hypothetical protein
MFSAVNEDTVWRDVDHCVMPKSDHHFDLRNPSTPSKDDVAQVWINIFCSKDFIFGHFVIGPLSAHLDISRVAASENKKSELRSRASQTWQKQRSVTGSGGRLVRSLGIPIMSFVFCFEETFQLSSPHLKNVVKDCSKSHDSTKKINQSKYS